MLSLGYKPVKMHTMHKDISIKVFVCFELAILKERPTTKCFCTLPDITLVGNKCKDTSFFLLMSSRIRFCVKIRLRWFYARWFR